MGTCKSACFTSRDKYPNPSTRNSTQTQPSSKESLQGKSKIEQLRQYFPHFDGHQCIVWKEVLSCLRNEVQRSRGNMNVLGHQVVGQVIQSFDKYCLTHTEKLQFLSFFHTLTLANFSPNRHQAIQKVCSQLAKRINSFQLRLEQKHKLSLQHFKFITSQHHEKKQYHLARFSQLQFSMSLRQIQSVAGIVRAFCQQDLSSFALMTLYLQICVVKNVNHFTGKKLYDTYVDSLEKLMTVYRAQDVGEEIMKSCKIMLLKISFTTPSEDTLAFEKGPCTNFQQLKDFISEKTQTAKLDIRQLQFLLQKFCFQLDEQIKFQLRFKNPSTFESLTEIFSQLVHSQTYEQAIKTSKQMFATRFRRNDVISAFTLMNLVKEETEYVDNVLRNILEKQSSISLKKVDYLMGFCKFSKLKRLLTAANHIIEWVQTQNYSILQLTNQLTQTQKSLCLTIEFPNTTVSIHLQLVQPSISNQFHQKISSLTQSQFYTPLTNLFVLNKQYSQHFFSHLFDTIDSISHHTMQDSSVHSSLRTTHDFGFMEISTHLEQFRIKYLEPLEIEFGEDPEQRIEEMTQILTKIKQIQSVIKHGNYPSYFKTSKMRQMNQTICEARFLFSIKNYKRAYSIIQKIKTSELENNQQALELKADIQSEIQLISQAQNTYQTLLRFYEKESEKNIQIYARVLQKLGDVQRKGKNYNHSLKSYEQSFNLRKTLSSLNSQANESFLLIKIGKLYSDQKEYKKAIAYFKMALSIEENLNGPSSLEYAQALELLGKAYQERKRHDKALDYNQKCLQIYQNIYGKQSLQCAQILNRIGASHLFKSNYDKALSSYQQSLTIHQRVKGRDTIYCVPALSSIGSVYEKCSQFNEALPYFRKCLSIVERTYGKNAIECVKALNDIIVTFYHMERFQEAVALGLRCLEIQETLKGKNSVDCSGTLFGLSIGYEKLHLLKQAISACQRSYEIRLKQLGPEHSLTKQAKQRLSDLQSAGVAIFC